MFNDLIGIAYGWGHSPGDGSGLTDCFQLSCEVRRRLGLKDLAESFAWVYQRYSEVSFPRAQVLRWLYREGVETEERRPGTMVYLPTDLGAVALGTVTDNGLIFISPGQNVVHAPVWPSLARYFWMDG